MSSAYTVPTILSQENKNKYLFLAFLLTEVRQENEDTGRGKSGKGSEGNKDWLWRLQIERGTGVEERKSKREKKHFKYYNKD